jgi:hypothetical protein
MNLHDTQRPQIYSYVNTDGGSDVEVITGDIDVIHVNWEKLDSDYFGDYEAADFLGDWRALRRINDPKIRKRERTDYLRLFREQAKDARANRHWLRDYEKRTRAEKLEAARKVLREAGELP